MNGLVNRLKQEGQDFEWYPTTAAMITIVRGFLPQDTQSILDIGAGDGNPVEEAIKYFKHNPYITVSNVKLLKG